MQTSKSQAVLITLLCLLCWLGGLRPAQAENSVFPSNSVSGSTATYVLQFESSVNGSVTNMEIVFPPDTLLGGTPGVGTPIFAGKPVKGTVTATVDPLDPDTLLVNLAKAGKLKRGIKNQIDVFNITNPAPGDQDLSGRAKITLHFGRSQRVVPSWQSLVMCEHKFSHLCMGYLFALMVVFPHQASVHP